MLDQRYRWGKTPDGDNAHLVGVQKSLLAQGTRNSADYQSVCGIVPRHWDFDADPDGPDEICSRCAESLLDRIPDFPTDLSDLEQAAEVHRQSVTGPDDNGGDDGD